MLNKIISKAKEAGACSLAETPRDWKDACRLLFSPQGREFCSGNDFPDRETITALSPYKEELALNGVMLDAGKVELEGDGDVCLIGDTQGMIRCYGVERISRVVLLGGATAEIFASDYAVVSVDCDSRSKYTITKDETAIVL